DLLRRHVGLELGVVLRLLGPYDVEGGNVGDLDVLVVLDRQRGVGPTRLRVEGGHAHADEGGRNDANEHDIHEPQEHAVPPSIRVPQTRSTTDKRPNNGVPTDVASEPATPLLWLVAVACLDASAERQLARLNWYCTGTPHARGQRADGRGLLSQVRERTEPDTELLGHDLGSSPRRGGRLHQRLVAQLALVTNGEVHAVGRGGSGLDSDVENRPRSRQVGNGHGHAVTRRVGSNGLRQTGFTRGLAHDGIEVYRFRPNLIRTDTGLANRVQHALHGGRVKVHRLVRRGCTRFHTRRQVGDVRNGVDAALGSDGDLPIPAADGRPGSARAHRLR